MWNSPPASRTLARRASISFIDNPRYSVTTSALLRPTHSLYWEISSFLRSFVIAKVFSPPFQTKSLCLATSVWQRLSGELGEPAWAGNSQVEQSSPRQEIKPLGGACCLGRSISPAETGYSFVSRGSDPAANLAGNSY